MVLIVGILVSFIIYCTKNANSQDSSAISKNTTSCSDKLGRPKLCHPPFLSVLHGRNVNVTSTCGLYGAVKYCVDSSLSKRTGTYYCDYCNDQDPKKRHPASFLTDYNDDSQPTWWQSESLHDVRLSNSKFGVNLTVDLGTQMQVTYVKLAFESPRPYSMAIYRKVHRNSSWEPWAYFSRDCQWEYGMEPDPDLSPSNEDLRLKAVCSSKHSNILPLTEENIIFPLLKDRIRSEQDAFWKDDGLQEWVLATQIRISLDRINSFGDIATQNSVRRSQKYFYAISDFAVGCRCNCNGHAAQCAALNPADAGGVGSNSNTDFKCVCQHFTEGENCERCRAGYFDQPWRRALPEVANECKKCNCNGNSEECFFNETLYVASGNKSGGHCLNCRFNSEGPHCERCRPNHTPMFAGSNVCVPCNCHIRGSLDAQCDVSGQCRCRPGVGGVKCDRCLTGFYNLTSNGCTPCNCHTPGTLNSTGACNSDSGACLCKQNVFGRSCDLCREGHFGLNTDDPLGCQPCFCYGHTLSCVVREGLVWAQVMSDFRRSRYDSDGWLVEADKSAARSQLYPRRDFVSSSQLPQLSNNSRGISYISIGSASLSGDNDLFYLAAPRKFLGDKSASFNAYLTLNVDTEAPLVPADLRFFDVELASGMNRFTARLDAQSSLPSSPGAFQLRFRLAYAPHYGWQPRSDAVQRFRLVLSNLTGIWVRAVYRESPRSVRLQLYRATLDMAVVAGSQPQTQGNVVTAKNMHTCSCPLAYAGHMCEQCAPGFTRELVHSGPFGKCVPCQCFNNAEKCDPETGVCYTANRLGKLAACSNNTAGRKCNRCADGFYGNATSGLPNACKPCVCPNNGTCLPPASSAPDAVPDCVQCPRGYEGPRCQFCRDGYWGVGYGLPGHAATPCVACSCNGNVDPNDVRPCDRRTGRCLKCAYNTGGERCERCRKGYFGDAFSEPRANCSACGCYKAGTDPTLVCLQHDGMCVCKDNVLGDKCDQCRSGFFNISSGRGCEACNCHSIGSTAANCELETGQCHCKTGVGGKACDRCLAGYYGFGKDGCQPCNCHPNGSNSLECSNEGQCPCKSLVLGQRCDMCAENQYNLPAGCRDTCGPCYGVIQQFVNSLRRKLNATVRLLEVGGIPVNSTNLSDVGTKVSELTQQVEALWSRSQHLVNGDHANTLGARLGKVRNDALNLTRQIRLSGSMVGNASHFAGTVWPLRRAQLADMLRQIELQIGMLSQQADVSVNLLGIARNVATAMSERNSRLNSIKEETGRVVERLDFDALRLNESAVRLLNDAERLRVAEKLLDPTLATLEMDATQLKSRLTSLEQLINKTEQRASNSALQAALYRQNATDASIQMDDMVMRMMQMRNRTLEHQSQLSHVRDRVALLSDELNSLRTLFSSETSRGFNDTLMLALRTFEQVRIFDKVLNRTYQEVMDIRRNMESMRVNASSMASAANSTLSKLLNFESVVNSSRLRADEALAREADINRNLDSAAQKTQTERERIAAAQTNVNEVLREVQQTRAESAALDSSASQKLSHSQQLAAEAANVSSSGAQLNSALDGLLGRTQTLLDKYASSQEQLDNLTRDSSIENTRVDKVERALGDLLAQMQDRVRKLTQDNREPSENELSWVEAQMSDLENQQSLLGTDLIGTRREILALQEVAKQTRFGLMELKEEHARIVRIAENMPSTGKNSWISESADPTFRR